MIKGEVRGEDDFQKSGSEKVVTSYPKPWFNPSNAEATFVQSTRVKTIETLSCWYSLDNSR